MTHILDTNICSAHMRRPALLAHRFIQYSGGLAIPSVVLAELFAGAYTHPSPSKILALIADLRSEVAVLDFNSECAERFGIIRSELMRQGLTIARMDALIASVALVYDLTLVTHNTADFQNVPDLRLVDWLLP